MFFLLVFSLSDIQLLSFGITNLIDDEFLAAISGDVLIPTGQQRLGYDYFTAPDFQALNSMYSALTSTLCRKPETSMYDITKLLYKQLKKM